MRLAERHWGWGMVVLLPVLVVGCKSTGGVGRGHPTHLYADPEFTPQEGMRLPIVAFSNTTTETDAAGYFFPYLEDALQERSGYQLVSSWAVQREARRKHVDQQLAALDTQWRKERTFDPAILKEFAAGLGVEHVVGGEVSEWSSEEIDFHAEGYSHSDVAASLKIFDVASGKLVWEARDALQMKSAHYDPASTADRIDDLGIARGESRMVPAPPPIDEVARRVAASLVAALP